jgi:hypothetical protein
VIHALFLSANEEEEENHMRIWASQRRWDAVDLIMMTQSYLTLLRPQNSTVVHIDQSSGIRPVGKGCLASLRSHTRCT